MAEKEYSIHSMAKKLDVSVSTLNSYLNRFKAFIPYGEKNGLKYYGPEAFEIVKTIVEWRRDKITLDEIQKNFKAMYPIVNPTDSNKGKEKGQEKEEKQQPSTTKKQDSKAKVDLKVLIAEREAKISELKKQIGLIERELEDYKKLYELMQKYDLTLLK